ncbi:hypothetical protein EDC04DRAFT_572440 [Pisolithus marmoratus]|nr:hypothetical protein EDC04DRAFT_572440 [Pisolithus marmoratus]
MSSATDPEAIINGFVDFIHPAFVVSVANTAFSASLFTLFVVLLALSTKESRRRTIFRLNVFAICLVLTMGVLVGFSNGKIVLGQLYWLPERDYVAAIAFILFTPLLCDSILLTRLLALYPLSTTRRATLLKIFAFPFCVKCARVVALVHYLVELSADVEDYNAFFRNPNLTAEWAMQIADNMYSVSFFLYNLHVRTSSIKCTVGMPARIRQIFYISAANFVFPLIFNIALIIFITATAATNQLAVIGGLLVLVNSYVTVMGVLCATVWFSRSKLARTRAKPLPDGMFSLKPNLGRVYDNGRKCGSEIMVVGERSDTPGTTDLEAGPVTNCQPPQP